MTFSLLKCLQHHNFIMLQRFGELLAASHQSQEAVRELERLKSENGQEYLQLCAQVLLSDDFDISVIHRAIIHIQSIMTLRISGANRVKQLWMSIPAEKQTEVQQALLRGLMFDSKEIVEVSAGVLASIAKICMNPMLLQSLFDMIQNKEGKMSEGACHGALITVREILERKCISRTSCGRSFLEIQRNIIGLGQGVLSQGPLPFKREAAKILASAFKVFRTASSGAEFRVGLMTLLQEHWKADPALHKTFYDILKVLFTTNYREYSEPELQMLFQFLQADSATNNEEYIFATLKFWKAVANFEYDTFYRGRSELTNLNVTKKFAECLVPTLFTLLGSVPEYSEDDPNNNAWTCSLGHEARATLLSFARVAPENVWQVGGPFCGEKIRSSEWTEVFAACSGIVVLATGFPLKDPEAIAFFKNAMSALQMLIAHPSLRIKEVAFCAIGSIVRWQDIFDTPAQEAEFMAMLMQRNMESDPLILSWLAWALKSYFRKFSSEMLESPLEISLSTFLEAFLAVCGSGRDAENAMTEAAGVMISRAPSSAKDVLTNFLGRILQALSTAPKPYGQTHLSLLWITRAILERFHTIRNVDPGPVEMSYQFFWSLATSSDMESCLGDIVSCVTSCFYAVSSVAKAHYQDVLVLLAKMQDSGDLTQIRASSIVIGDIWRQVHDPQDMTLQAHAESFIRMFLANIDKYAETSLLRELLMNLADVVSFSGEASRPFRDEIVTLIDTITKFYNPETEAEIMTVTPIWESVLFLSRAIFMAYPRDLDFFRNREVTKILFGLIVERKINAKTFHEPSTWNALVLFLDEAAKVRDRARLYNNLLNHAVIMEYLQSIEREGNKPENSSTVSRSIVSRARSLFHQMPKL